MFRLTGSSSERHFLHQVMADSRQNLLECLQCGKCSGGCPITSETVGGPRKLIAKILAGMKKEALTDPTWWYCVSCGTCAVRCPVEINMYPVATTLCELAEKEGYRPAEPKISLFEELFLKSVQKTGRVQEIKTVMEYNLRTLNPFKDMLAGLKMMRSGAISPLELFEKKSENPQISAIFSRVAEIRNSQLTIAKDAPH